jgi:drug/metabolite transporter (DMT)-like permease
MSVLFTMILAPCITKEEVTRLDYFGAILILIGCGITTASGTHTEILYTYDQLYAFLIDATFLILLGCMIILSLTCYYLKGVKSIEEHPKWKKIRPLFFGLICGFFGSMENVVMKCTSNIMTIEAFYASWPFYVLAFFVIFFAINQIMWLNKGLEQFEGTTFLPVYNTSLILLSTLVGRLEHSRIMSSHLPCI